MQDALPAKFSKSGGMAELVFFEFPAELHLRKMSTAINIKVVMRANLLYLKRVIIGTLNIDDIFQTAWAETVKLALFQN